MCRISYRPCLSIDCFPIRCDKLVLQLQLHDFLDSIYRIESGSHILERTSRVLPRALNGLFFIFFVCGTPSQWVSKSRRSFLRYEKEKNLLHEMTLWCYSSLWEKTVRFYEWTCFAAAWLQSNCKVELRTGYTHTHTQTQTTKMYDFVAFMNLVIHSLSLCKPRIIMVETNYVFILGSGLDHSHHSSGR